jgi:hypothetical protein
MSPKADLRRQTALLDAWWTGIEQATIVQVVHKSIWENAPLPLSILSRPTPLILILESDMANRFSFVELEPWIVFRFL